MIATSVYVHVKEDHIEAFKEAILANHRGSVQEPGNIRFDVLQAEDDPSRFMLYEVFESEEAIQAHRESDHYLTWRDTVETFMADKRQAQRYEILAPADYGS